MEIKYNNHQTENNPIKLGAQLRQAREAAHLTQSDVAQQLHLTLGTIAALEDQAFDKLVSPTFVKGYLRMYANLLYLSAEEIIQAYNQLGYPEQQAFKLPKTTTKTESVLAVRLVRFILVIILIILLGFAGRWIYWQAISHYYSIGLERNTLQNNNKISFQPTFNNG